MNRAVARHFFGVGAAVSLGGAAAIALQDLHLAPAVAVGLVGACLAMAALFALASWKAHALPPQTAVLGTAWAACLLVTGVAVASGFSIQSHSLGFIGLLVCLVAVLAGIRHAGAMTLYAGGVISALAAAESAGWLNGAATVAAAPPSDPIVSQWLLLGAGLGIGLILARVVNESYRAFAEREARFHALLKMAADRYWELDSDLRFVRADPTTSSILAITPDRCIGLRPWETPDQMGIAAAEQDRHKQDLYAHRAFARLRTCVRLESGAMRHLDVSGQPRFDMQGNFAGYWGVARDVSEEVFAEQALRHSQAILALLFENSPDCITLSDLDGGRYKMVNGGFTRLMGYAADEVVGRTTAELGVWHSAAARDAFIDAVRQHGQVREHRCVFVAKSGALIVMRVSASRCVIDAQECLIINAHDVTQSERTRMEYAAILQRASIGIAFTRDRQFATANPCFERMFGWDGGTLAGQAGRVVWPSDGDYADVSRLAGPLLELGQPVELERLMRRKDGSLFWCRLLAQALDPADPRAGGTIWIAEDVTERRHTEQALAAARDAAEAASRAKSAFLANTSHEIRTPLNGLLGMARLALQPGVEDGRRQQYLNHILDSAQNLAGIISDILDLSKVEAGRVDLEHISFGLRELLTSLHQAYLPLAEAKGLELTLQMDIDVPRDVIGDPLRVRQILSNFITNALKFTDRGQVRIDARRLAATRIRFDVVDTGPGIDERTQQRLFLPFSQADQSTTRRFGGTGLGLSISRELAHLMGGEVGLHSVPGAGSTFWAELPLTDTPADAAPGAAQAADISLLRGARILIAEDNPVNMLITVALLEQWGVHVTQAGDGDAAIEAVRRAALSDRPVDVVLMDMHMPKLSGYAAARDLRQEFSARQLPIIALTAAALVSERDEALQAGMCDFLTKPIDAERMLRTLARHLERVPAG